MEKDFCVRCRTPCLQCLNLIEKRAIHRGRHKIYCSNKCNQRRKRQREKALEDGLRPMGSWGEFDLLDDAINKEE